MSLRNRSTGKYFEEHNKYEKSCNEHLKEKLRRNMDKPWGRAGHQEAMWHEERESKGKNRITITILQDWTVRRERRNGTHPTGKIFQKRGN
jgi:hypothetical protein